VLFQTNMNPVCFVVHKQEKSDPNRHSQFNINIMRSWKTSTASWRLSKSGFSSGLNLSKRCYSLGPTPPSQPDISLGPPFRLILEIEERSVPLLKSLRLRSRTWPQGPPGPTSPTRKRMHTALALLHHLPPEYLSLYDEIINEACSNHPKFEMGNGFPFLYPRETGLGLRLRSPRDIISICNKFCKALEGNIDGRLSTPDFLYLPLSTGLSQVATERLLANLKDSYPHGIPFGRARGLFLLEHAGHGHKYHPQTIEFKRNN
jgi:hypothetical protein